MDKHDRNESEMVGGISRRTVLSVMGGLAAGATMPSLLSGQGTGAQPITPITGSINPRRYGFNLLEYFSIDEDWMQHFPYKLGDFVEDDFRWMRDWGFNFARLPIDYRLWADPKDMMKISEKKVEPIDHAIKLGEKYGVQININLCRALQRNLRQTAQLQSCQRAARARRRSRQRHEGLRAAGACLHQRHSRQGPRSDDRIRRVHGGARACV
jgi:hypothetical protein